MMNVYVFAGQGSQFKGMGKKLFEEFGDLVAQANSVLGYSIEDVCINNPENKLNKTEYTQPAIFIVNALSYLKLKKDGLEKPDYFLGHSLGEYNALFAAGAFDFITGVKLVAERGKLMARANDGGMYAVIGLDEQKVRKVIEENNLKEIDIANINSYSQIVIAGPKDVLQNSKKLFEKEGASRIVELAVSGAFHSRYMKSASKEFAKVISKIEFNKLEYNVVSNTYATVYKDKYIGETLVEQIKKPVRWLDSIKYLLTLGEINILQIGLGKSIEKMTNEIIKDTKENKFVVKENVWNIYENILKQTGNSKKYIFVENSSETIFTGNSVVEKVNNVGSVLQKNLLIGSKVLIILPSNMQYVFSLLACFQAGVVAIPVSISKAEDWKQERNKVKVIADDAKIDAIITNKEFIPNNLDMEFGVKVYMIEDMLKNSINRLSVRNVLENQIGLLLYTSGSTSNPKGVMISHKNILAISKISTKRFELDISSKIVSWLPMYHCFGLIVNVFSAIFSGAEVYLSLPQSFIEKPESWLMNISSYKATHTAAPNFAFNVCNEIEYLQENTDLSSLKAIICGGEPVQKLTYEKFMNKFQVYGLEKNTFLPHYGMTEAGCISCKKSNDGKVFIPVNKNEFYNGKIIISNQETQVKWIASCGRIENPINVVIVDPVKNVPVSKNEIGEIWINSPEVAMGYLNNKQESEASFNGRLELGDKQYFKTGDLGVFIDDEIYIVGREKEIIVINGKNCYPTDFEITIKDIISEERIDDVVVFGIEEGNNEKVIVVCETNIKEILSLKKYKDIINKEIWKNYQVPIYEILFIKKGSLPKTGSGKISRNRCRNYYLNRMFEIIYSHKFETGNQIYNQIELLDKESKSIVKFLCDILKISSEQINLQSNIFEYGLNSINLMRMRYKIKEVFEKELTLDEIFSSKNIKDMLEKIKGEAVVCVEKSSHINKMDEYKRKGIIPLTCAQKGLWITQKIKPDTTAYNVPICLKLDKILELRYLEQAIRHVAYCNPILNSVVQEEKDEVVIRLLEPECLQIDYQEVNESVAIQLINKYSKEPFEFESSPLMRIKLFKTNKNQYYLLFVIHHIIFDGKSMTLIINELFETYKNIVESKELKNTRKNTECYYDVYNQELDLLKSDKGKNMLAYWKKQLSETQCVLNIESPYEITSEQKRGEVLFDLSAEKIQKVSEFAQMEKIQLSTVFLAVYVSLLHFYSKQNEFVLGIPVMKREASVLEKIVGYFINMIPMKVEFSLESSVSNFLHDIQRNFIIGLSNSDYPFSQIVKQINNVNRFLVDNSIFQTSFAYQNFYEEFDEKDIKATYEKFFKIDFIKDISQEGEFDFIVEVNEMKYNLEICIKYDAQKYDMNFMEGFVKRYMNILENIQNKKYVYEILEDDEIDIIHLLEEQVNKFPEKEAIVCNNKTITYKEIWHKSNELANYFSCYTNKGAHIVVCLEQSIEWVITMFGIMKAGCVYVPIDCKYPDERIKYIISDCNAEMVITDKKNQSRLEGISGNIKDINFLLEAKQNLTKEKHSMYPNLNDTAYIIYTSGSTGNPKGTIIEHGGISALSQYFCDNKIITDSDLVTQFFSIAFDASLNEVFTTLLLGATLVIVPRNCIEDVELYEDFLTENKITVAFLPPSYLSNVNVDKNYSLRKILTGGASMDYALVKKWIDKVDYINLYGPTENTITTTAWICKRGERLKERGNVPIGKEINGKNVVILDDNGKRVAHGEIGEICITGVGLAKGYLNNPKMTKEKFVYFSENIRMYKTGDLGYRDEKGLIHYKGRMDEQVKYHGYRIELSEIEEKIKSYFDIKDVAVILQNSDGIERLLAFCVWESGEEKNLSLKEYLKKSLPGYMIPSFFISLLELPYTINGKVDKAKLKEKGKHIEKRKNIQNPSNEIEERMLKVWEKVLNVTGIDMDDTFFEAGGDSILAVKLSKEISSEFTINMNVTTIFQYPSIKKISQYLKESRLKEKSDNVELKEGVENEKYDDSDIAIIGIAFDIPGANNITQLWSNLCNSVESIKSMTEAEIKKYPNGDSLLKEANFIPVKATIANKYGFDNSFFKLSPRDVEMMSIEARLLLSHSFYALSDAGYKINSIPDTAVYMTTSHSSNVNNEDYAAQTYAKTGTISTLISYKLGLMGPSVYVNTNCSSSLVALHMACNSIRNNEAEYALVGASCVGKDTPGYIHNANMNQSSSGHIKAFDADADGIVGGDGVIVFLLKNAGKAVKDGDSIYAIIKGSAINNDGNDKVGYYAPSVNGQQDVIKKAIHNARVNPETIKYIEAHGTGTKIGDPIEIEALTGAYKFYTHKKQFIGIGSIKTNIGHLDTVAGLAGCLKLILCLKNKMFVPTLNFKKLNPNIDLVNSPFYITDKLAVWNKGDSPRRGAVSSFGIGGTNVHMILEEYVEKKSANDKLGEDYKYVIPVSAKNSMLLREYIISLLNYLQDNENVNLADFAYTLQIGRETQSEKVIFVVKTRKELIKKMEDFLNQRNNMKGWF